MNIQFGLEVIYPVYLTEYVSRDLSSVANILRHSVASTPSFSGSLQPSLQYNLEYSLDRAL